MLYKALVLTLSFLAIGSESLALFLMVGAVLPIRRKVLVRSQCVIGAFTLAPAPPMLIATYVGLPEEIFSFDPAIRPPG